MRGATVITNADIRNRGYPLPHHHCRVDRLRCMGVPLVLLPPPAPATSSPPPFPPPSPTLLNLPRSTTAAGATITAPPPSPSPPPPPPPPPPPLRHHYHRRHHPRRRWWWGSGYPRLRMSVLVMTVTPHIHRQYGHVLPWRKPLGDASLSPLGIRRISCFAGKRTGNISPPCPQRDDRQRTVILLLFVSNPTRRHRHLRTVLPVLLQTRNGSGGHSERLFHR